LPRWKPRPLTMKKFSFNLETLRRYRTTIEEKERFALARLQWILRSATDQLELLCRREQEAVAELVRLRSGPTPDDPDAQMYDLYARRLRLGIEQSRQQVARLEKEIQSQKALVIEATKKKRVLDLLRAKREKQFMAAVETLEQKTVDEMVVSRFVHKEL
jgi:flagellar protein FliJ